jgi:polyisoprenoid-binding protein YceI
MRRSCASPKVIVSLLATGLAASSTLPITAQSLQPRTIQKTDLAAGRKVSSGEIETSKSRIYVFVEKTGFGHQHGVVGRLKGGSVPVAGRRAGQMIFDLKSFAADAADARRYVGLEGEIAAGTQGQITETMAGPAVLDVDRIPTAAFTIASLRPLNTKSAKGKPQYELDGQLTLRGTTRPLKITVERTEEKGMLHLQGSFPLTQSDFGIRPYKKAFGAVGVADELTVYGDIWAGK